MAKYSEIEKDPYLDLIINKVIDIVCDYEKIPTDYVFKRNRNIDFVIPRNIIVFICFENFKIRTKYMSFFFNRDHSTLSKGWKTIKGYYETDKSFCHKIEVIRERIVIEFSDKCAK